MFRLKTCLQPRLSSRWLSQTL